MDILTNFGIQPTLLLAQIVNFLIILFLLKKFFFAPIVKVLDDRKKRIEQSLQNADLIEEKLQKTEENSKKIFDEARQSAKTIIQEAKAEAQRITDEAISQSRKTQEEALVSSKAQIEAQRQKMQKDLEKETLILVAQVVKKVLGRTLKAKEQQELTQRAMAEIGKQL